MTASEESGPKPGGDPPDFLVGSRPSFLDIVSSHPSFPERSAEGKDAKQRDIDALSNKVDSVSKHTIQMSVTRWLIIAALASIIFCTAWIAWSVHELHGFALRQAKSLNDSIEISRYAILASNRRAEAAEKMLVGQKATPAMFEAAARQAIAGAKPYRENAFKVELTKRAIVRALSIAGGLV